jgi:hypothetical protein
MITQSVNRINRRLASIKAHTCLYNPVLSIQKAGDVVKCKMFKGWLTISNAERREIHLAPQGHRFQHSTAF